LEAYLRPGSSEVDRQLAQIEGWILGVPTDEDRHFAETVAHRPL